MCYEKILTKRELEILELIAKGYTNKNISEHLGIKESTVENHIHNMFKKLNLSNRSQATAYAYQIGIVVPQLTKLKR